MKKMETFSGTDIKKFQDEINAFVEKHTGIVGQAYPVLIRRDDDLFEVEHYAYLWYDVEADNAAKTPGSTSSTPPKENPVRTDYSGFGGAKQSGGFGDWGFVKGARVEMGDSIATITWGPGNTDEVELDTLIKKVSQNNNLYYQGFVDGKEVRLVKSKIGWGVSMKGGV